MQLVPFDQIVIDPFRVRETFSPTKADELRNSIARIGLIHPINVHDNGSQLVLITGERRLRAIKELGSYTYAGQQVENAAVVVVWDKLTPDILLEIEIEENATREDVPWAEHVKAVKRLHDLRTSQTPKHTMAETGLELKISTPEVSKMLLVAGHLEDKTVSGASSANEAYKRVTRKIERTLLAEVAMRQMKVGAKESPFILKEGKMEDILLEFQEPSSLFDVCLTDPPYGTNAQNFSNDAANAHSYDDSENNFLNHYRSWVEAITLVMKPKAHAYWFLEWRYFPLVKVAFEQQGWEVYPRPLVWIKGNQITPGNAAIWPGRTYEMCLFANRGNRPLIQTKGDSFNIPNEANKVHAAQKPVELFQELLGRSLYPGDRVLDPFCGSGTIFAAAKDLSCKVLGIDLDTKTARERIALL